jgi:hypothetical protein
VCDSLAVTFLGPSHELLLLSDDLLSPNHTACDRHAKLILNGQSTIHRHNGLLSASKFKFSLSNSAMADVVRGRVKRWCFRIFDWLRDHETPRPPPTSQTKIRKLSFRM